MTINNPSILITSTGDVRSFSEWGCYPVFYLTGGDEVMCPGCVQALIDHTDPEAVLQIDAHDINWEDTALYCEGCDNRIPSAYAEDDDED